MPYSLKRFPQFPIRRKFFLENCLFVYAVHIYCDRTSGSPEESIPESLY